jgi:Sugar (and other) transporter
MSAFQAVFAICLVLQAMVLPDSPRWLIAHDRKEEGTQVLAMLEDRDVDHPHVLLKVKEIEDSLAQESAGGALIFGRG